MGNRILKNTDLILLLVISLYSIIITVFDLFDITTKVSWLNNADYGMIAVLILAFIGLHLVISKIQSDKFQKESLGQSHEIITSLDGIYIKSFSNAQKMEEYLSKRILEAEEEICDLTWKNTLSLGINTKPRLKSQRQVESSINKRSKEVTYKEVFVFSNERLIESRIKKLKTRIAQNNPGYSCRYYEPEKNIPRIQFVIIDKKEIIFASSSFPKLCSVNHPSLAENFQHYFDQIWVNAIPLKEGTDLYDENISKIITDD
jgi:hypothetical protein